MASRLCCPLIWCLLAATAPAQAIVGGTATSDFRHVSSGVQFNANWVLTAGHVGDAVDGSYSNGYGSALIAARYDLGPGPFPADDLALLRLATPIAAPTLQLFDTLLAAGPLAQPLDVTISTGSNQQPRGYAFSQLREVLDSIDPDDLPGQPGPLPPVAVNWLVTYSASVGAPHVEGGDSGGGLFLGSVGDSRAALLMGITSSLLDFDTGGRGSAFVQLAAYRSWIDATLATDLADNQVALWASAVPEPAGWALGMAGVLLVGAAATRRRRHSAA